VDIHARTAANRRLLADFFDRLDEDQLQTRSLCDAWTVREVLVHLVMPLTGRRLRPPKSAGQGSIAFRP